VTQDLVITNCRPASTTQIPFQFQYDNQPFLLTYTVNVLTDSCRLGTGVCTLVKATANVSLTLNIKSKDNWSDLAFASSMTGTGITAPFAYDYLVELPGTNRTAQQIRDLTNTAVGFYATSSDYGVMTKTVMEPSATWTYTGLPTLITTPADHDSLYYDNASGKWKNMTHVMPVAEVSWVNSATALQLNAITASYDILTKTGGITFTMTSNTDPAYTLAFADWPSIVVPSAIDDQLYHIAVSICGYVSTTGMTLELALAKNTISNVIAKSQTQWDVPQSTPTSFAFHTAEILIGGTDTLLLVCRHRGTPKDFFVHNINMVMMGSKHAMSA
jgi:hypothetical protein